MAFTRSCIIAAPYGVSGPFNVFVVSGYVIDAQWRRPSGRTGALTMYILRAVNRDKPDMQPVEAVFTNTTDTLQGLSGE